MNFLLWLVFGGIAGWIASKIMGTDAQQGIFLNVVVGIIGAYIGGFIAQAIGIGSTNLIVSLIIAIVGACILLFIVSLVTGRRRV